MTDQDAPIPNFLPSQPPSHSTKPLLDELKTILKDEVEKKTKDFNEVSTPVAFATLANDVKHLRIYFAILAGVGAAIVAGIFTGYIHIDGKISTLNEKLNTIALNSKDTEAKYQILEGKINGDIKGINNRVDDIIVENGHDVKK